MNEKALGAASDNGRYRTLLEVSGAIASQPSLQAILQSLRRLLSKVVPFDAVSILLLSDDGKSIRLFAFDSGEERPRIEIGAEIPFTGTSAGRAIDEQEPIYVPDLKAELARIPKLAVHAQGNNLHSGYVFPISTSRKKLGALTFSKIDEGEVSADDLQLMGSVASHVAIAIESALATDNAEFYHRKLAEERDRLRLLLEINNHLVSHLDVCALFRAASASLRKYFANDFAGFWLIDKHRRHLDCAVLDFPDSRGLLAEVSIPELTDEDLEKTYARRPELWTRKEIDNLPSAVLEHLNAESIEEIAIAPLLGSNGPLGAIALGSRRLNHFGHEDLDLLSQIATQISLSVDNALAYGRLAASRDRLEEERLYLESEIRSEYNFEDIVGKSAALRAVLNQVAIVAPTGSTVLLHGETGTGKELIARAIHSISPRKDRTFVRLNCSAIPSGLLESELFGHEKGAFTGALMQKRGRFEIADHGTLFLDEIGDITLELQPKLLRALQEQEFERLGSTKTIQVDVRLIAATHRDLSAMIRNQQFREDLFYRLNVFPIEIPPLRERREDIPLLVHYFVSRLSRRMQKTIQTISKEAMDALTNATWPGNVRELANFIERAVILTPGTDLNVPIHELKRNSSRAETTASSFEEAERQAILEALKASSGRISGQGGAAERLGLKRTTLQNKMRKLHIARTAF
ncbi:MAG TPA: sigma 54-interacting transcriptional regulator [Candidatus Saccharimonadales bacterium]|nr:sigma 54-interacting transcriptional regulator [Candidatus Saccharimonadales bacterium]